MAAIMLNVVTAPALELGVEQRTWKPVHCAKRASAVRNVCAGCMGSFERVRAVLPKIGILSTIVAQIHVSRPLRLTDEGTTVAASCTHLAEAANSRPPLRFRQGASPLVAHQA